MMLGTEDNPPSADLVPLPPGACVPTPKTEQRMLWRAAFAEAFARNGGDMVAAVRAAVERFGGTEKDRTRPSEVARRLLKQGPVRARILELGGAVPPLREPMVAPRESGAPAREVRARARRDRGSLLADTAARLAAVAFDPDVPPEVACAAAEALRTALDAREVAP